MKLTFEQIKNITTGAVKVTEKDGKVSFARFTDEQVQLYDRVCREKNSSLNTRCRAAAGIRLRFKTNSQKLKMIVEVSKCT